MTVSYEVDRGSSQVKNRPQNPPVPVEFFPQSHDLEAMTHDFGTFGPGKVSQPLPESIREWLLWGRFTPWYLSVCLEKVPQPEEWFHGQESHQEP